MYPKRVLHVVSRMNRGGAESMLMNLYRNIDQTKVQFDFISHGFEKCDYEEEIHNLGGDIYKIASLGESGFLKYIFDLIKIIKYRGDYSIIHIHTDYQIGIVAFAAMIANVPVRICHSHNTRWECTKTVKEKVLFNILKKMAILFSNKYVACGEDAAKFLYGDTNMKKKDIFILNNGIDIDSFITDEDDIKRLKRELLIKNNDLIIGHIGRFYEQKNHRFIIKLSCALHKKDINFKILLIGEGPLKESIINEVKEHKLEDKVLFLGKRTDVPLLFNVFDVFLLPSLYEGLPLVLVEAQAAKVNSIVASTVTKEVDLGLDLVDFLDIEDNIDLWVELLVKRSKNRHLNKSKDVYETLTARGYNVSKNIDDLYYLYDIK